MSDTTDLIARLRDNAQGISLGAEGMGWGFDEAILQEAADALEQQAAQIAEKDAEIARLTECLSKANANHEHFERAWYLRGDVNEALRADAERMRAELISCRGSVKTEHHHYERLSMVHGKTPHGECYWTEAQRLAGLLDRIDSLAAIDAALRQEQPT